MDLFEQSREALLSRNAPLADRMRPRTLDEFVGQEHILGPGRLLRRAIQIDQLSSLIFYGPPGTGKTTLARIIANTTKAQFLSINAVLAGVKDIRGAIESARETLALHGKRTILFIDEVHRFNKAQQDALLPHVEHGVIILIGATTENPFFEVNKALVSRSRIFQLRPLGPADLHAVACHALTDKQRGYGGRPVRADPRAIEHLVRAANGDARGVLNALELAVETTPPDAGGVIHVTEAVAEESIQKKAVLYDKDGDAHYDTVSAFIKSVRGSDPDAALYWMARMVYAGEDPRFIFRRMMILACEDIGMADPQALRVVVSAAQAFDYVGLPEGRFHLAHACLYLATAPKSNSSMAFFDALDAVTKEQASDDVPNHLRDASRDSEGLGHGQGYLYPHAYRDHWVAQQYLPEILQGRIFYTPGDQGYEKRIKDRVSRTREAMVEAMTEEPHDGLTGRGAKGTGAGAWASRTASLSSLGRIRDAIFDLSEIRRDSLVLDLHARTGLLTLEAVRRAPEGSVWALSHDRESEAALASAADGFPALSRPQIVPATFETFESDLARCAGAEVRFTTIVGRSVLTRAGRRRDLVERFVNLLDRGGICVLAETVPAEGQRLSELLSFTERQSAAREALRRAEEELFGDPADPMVNFTADTLAGELGGLAGARSEVHGERVDERRRIGREQIDNWFRSGAEDGRRSLGDRLRELAGGQVTEELRELMKAQLAHKEVAWKSTVAFVRIVKEHGG